MKYNKEFFEWIWKTKTIELERAINKYDFKNKVEKYISPPQDMEV